MRLMWCDETNKQPGEHIDYFIYGGLIVNAEHAKQLHDSIAAARTKAGLQPGDSFKFNTRSKPDHIDIDLWTEAKSDVLRACQETETWFAAVIVHHDIARNHQDNMLGFQINWLLDTLNRRLEANNEDAFVFIDRSEGKEFGIMQDRFQHGGRGPKPRDFNRILGYGSTCDQASHIASAADIVLGGFRYCVNQQGADRPTSKIAPQIAPLLLQGHRNGQAIKMVPTRSAHDADYQHLRRHLRTLGFDT